MARQQLQRFNPDTHVRLDDGTIVEKKIVAASGSAVSGELAKTPLGKALSDADVAAVKAAMEDGVDLNDGQKIRDYKARFREEARQRHAQEEATNAASSQE